MNDARGRHGVLCLNGLNQRLALEAKAGELVRRELNVDFFVLCAENIDLRNIIDRKKPSAGTLHIVAQLPLREAVRSEGIDGPIGVAELVVKERTDNT